TPHSQSPNHQPEPPPPPPAAAAATEATKAAAEPSTSTEPSSESAAKGTDSARPPASATPTSSESPPSSHAPRDDVDHQEQHEQGHDEAATGSWLCRAPTLGRTNTLKGDIAALGDPADDALRACEQSLAVLAASERRRHVVATRLAGEAVGDERLELVADFNAHPPVLDRHENQQPVVATALANPPTAVLEHFHRVLIDVRVWRERVDRGYDDDVTGPLLERPDERLHRTRARIVDDASEIVDRL